MASSCSYFYINKDDEKYNVKNNVCFAGLNNSLKSSKKAVIVIEYDKSEFTLQQQKLYINDLKKIGFKVELFDNKKEKRLEIDIIKLKREQAVLFGMYVRFLWEGFGPFQDSYARAYDYDYYHEIMYIYFKYRSKFENKFLFLNFLVSIFSHKKKYNSNHFPCTEDSVVPLFNDFKDLSEKLINSGSINRVMTCKNVSENFKAFVEDFYKDTTPEGKDNVFTFHKTKFKLKKLTEFYVCYVSDIKLSKII